MGVGLLMSLLVFVPKLEPQQTQAGFWSHIQGDRSVIRPEPVSLAKIQSDALVALIRARLKADVEGCDDADSIAQLLGGLTFAALEIAPGQPTDGRLILVQAGAGCARGAQGANGAMWLFRVKGPRAALLAAPEQGFYGWFYSVQKTTGQGLPDMILGWHMGATEQVLTYFRFDGARYHSLGSATLREDENGKETLTPEPARK